MEHAFKLFSYVAQEKHNRNNLNSPIPGAHNCFSEFFPYKYQYLFFIKWYLHIFIELTKKEITMNTGTLDYVKSKMRER